MIIKIERFFNRSITKFILAFLIILSVLPIHYIRKLDPIFFLIFSIELILRFIIYFKVTKEKKFFEKFMLFTDLMAVLSFIPIPAHIIGIRYFRFLRLIRLSLLIRLAKSVATDLLNIVLRKEIRYQLGFLLGSVLIMALLGGIVLHALQTPVDLNNDGLIESGTLTDLLWWSFRQIESQDNITQNLNGPFIYIIISLILTATGVFIMSLIIGIGTSVVEELLQLSKEKSVSLSNHIVVLGTGRNIRDFLIELVRINKKNKEKSSIVLLSNISNPVFLYENELKKIEYRNGDPTDLRSLNLTNIQEADKIIILYDDEKKSLADSYTISSVLAAREISNSPILVELRHRRNIKAVTKAAGSNITTIPMGKFLGNLLCQNLIFPGIDRVFEELLSSHGSEIYTTFYTEIEKNNLKASKLKINFSDLLFYCYKEFGVILLGFFIENDNNEIQCLNPLVNLDKFDGLVPVEKITGLIGIARDKWIFENIKKVLFAEEINTLNNNNQKYNIKLSDSLTKLNNVLIIGENEKLPSLIEETIKFVPDVNLTVIIPRKSDREYIDTETKKRLGYYITNEESEEVIVKCISMSKSNKLKIMYCEEDVIWNLMHNKELQDQNFDNIVFLLDPSANDPDAQNLLWIFKIMDLVDDNILKVSEKFQILAEISTSEKGELVEKRFITSKGRRVKVISTQTIRSYFMVHNSFVSKILYIYEELLGSAGQDFCQIEIEPTEGKTTFSNLLYDLSKSGVILFGMEICKSNSDTKLIINPKPDHEIELKYLRKLYVIGDTEILIKNKF